jgi:hypothetical protein
MSHDEAMAEVWTFNGHFKPIGELLASRALTERDLAWAAFIADRINPRIKEAARTILAHKLTLRAVQTSSLGKGPKVMIGSDYLRHNERWSFGEVFYIAGLASAFALWLVVTFAQEWLKGTMTVPVVIVVVGMLIVVVRQIAGQGRRAYREYEAYKKGREGEDKIAERAVANLDGNWTIFRNFVLPDRKDDIDLLLVGPGGIVALEVKTYAPGTKTAAATSKRRSWLPRQAAAPLTPDGQASLNAARLKQLLAQRNCDVGWVQAVLVFAEYQPADFTKTSDKLDVWTSTEIDDRLVQLRAMTRLSEQQVEKVVAELKSMQAST